MAKTPKETVKLVLRGARAEQGIELDSLEHFIEHFRAALRDFERSYSERPHEVGRGGQPSARSKAATRFVLVGYSVGCAVLELADASPRSDEGEMEFDLEGAATQNLRAMLDGIDAGALEMAVVDSLDEARRALGEDGDISVRVPKRRRRARINSRTIMRLREAVHTVPKPALVTVYGKLHTLATPESPRPRVEIHATDNYNWTCLYDNDLREKVLPLIDKRVWARGLGTREKPNRGTLRLTDIGQLPELEATPLFTYEPIPAQELEQAQGVAGPQGIAALSFADEPGEDLERFLTVMREG